MNVMDRLESGETLILDGATGSELHRRGVNVSEGASPGRLGAWSATASLEAPDVLQQIHEDYLRVGADIITTNTFFTYASRLACIGKSEEWEAHARSAARIAQVARERVRPGAYVAGSIAPSPDIGDVWADLGAASAVLVEEGADVLLAEYLGTIDDCLRAIETCGGSGLPLFLGLRHVTEDGTLQYGESFTDLGEALEGREPASVLLMCSAPEAISRCLPLLREVFDGPTGAYGNIGYERNPEFTGHQDEQWHRFDQGRLDAYRPERYATWVNQWVSCGAQIVGGCCGTGPAHIEAVNRERQKC